eukprot:3102950-Rhodomonas_salina.2
MDVSNFDDTFTHDKVPPYASATRCPVPTQRMVLSSYARRLRCAVLRYRTVLSADAPAVVLRSHMGLSAYTSAGTDTSYGAIGLRRCYAISGTELASGATSLGVTRSSYGILASRSHPP